MLCEQFKVDLLKNYMGQNLRTELYRNSCVLNNWNYHQGKPVKCQTEKKAFVGKNNELLVKRKRRIFICLY